MKYLKTKGISKASNVYFDHNTKIGYSYKWYQIARQIKGLMIINNYNYSPTTIRHYHKIDKLLSKTYNNIVYIEAPDGLQELETSKLYYQNKIETLKAEIAKPRTKPLKNLKRQQLIEFYKGKIQLIESLL